MVDLVGLVLAAGGGSRFGGPKALARHTDGTPWLHLAVRVLEAGGCGEVVVVVGAQAAAARALLPAGARGVTADRWATGVAASLAAGLAALPAAEAVLIGLVDLPDLPVPVVERVTAGGTGRDRLARAVYNGRPGHPVLVGAAHWARLRAAVGGDEGGREYLEAHGADRVECGDLFDGEDVDRARRV